MNNVSVLTNFCNIFSSPQGLKLFSAGNYQGLWVDSKTFKTLEWFRLTRIRFQPGLWLSSMTNMQYGAPRISWINFAACFTGACSKVSRRNPSSWHNWG